MLFVVTFTFLIDGKYSKVYIVSETRPHPTLTSTPRITSKNQAALHRAETVMADAALPEGWIKKESSRHPGRYYYYNTVTKVKERRLVREEC